MTDIQIYLAGLPADIQERLAPVFGDTDRLYAAVYLVARNEHVVSLEKPDRYEDRLRTIEAVKKKIEKLLDARGLDGATVVADIAGDYFDDFVAYREPDFGLTDEEFVELVRKIVAAEA